MWKGILTVAVVVLGVILYNWDEMPSETHQWASSAANESEENREKFLGMNKSAFILGYTGETGKVLVDELIRTQVFSKVVLIGRREVQYEDEDHKKLEQRAVDFEKLDDHKEAFDGIDVGFCCLGTTKGKAGKDGFYKVDHDYVVNSATIAKQAGCSHFHLVSGQGANHNSMLFYPKVKGEVEEELKSMEFDRLSIYRPAMLMCDREERRPMEAVARALMKPVQWAAPTFITVPTTTVATAMVTAAITPSDKKVETFDNKAIHLLAGYGKKTKKTKAQEQTE